MRKKFKSTEYPTIGRSPIWWHRPLSPIITLIFLVLAVLVIFIIGVWFTTEYIRIYSQIPKIPPVDSSINP